jgi:molecular chaperone GrpE
MTEKATPDTEEQDPDAAPAPDGAGARSHERPSTRPDGDAGAESESGDRPQESHPGEAAVAEEPREATGEMDPDGALDRLQEEYDDLNDRHLRLAAEFTNYRRRQEAQMTEAWGRAQSDLLGRFLEVLDDLHRVSGLDPEDEAVSVQSIVEGVDLVERKFLRSLEEAGVEVLAPEGEPFDPEVMEAMMRVPASSEEEDDVVAQVFQPGYVLKGHLVRPARVSVYKAE